jgi:SAM-dependent methyltransferase
MSGGNERFNAEAAAWDSNPDVHRFSDGARDALFAALPALAEAARTGRPAPLDNLEIGCGTGLLSLRLAPYVRSILAVDAAQGMIDALALKLARGDGGAGAANVTPLCVMLEDPEDPALPAAEDGRGRKKFDLVTSHLVLHHIPDLALLLKTMHGCLKPGGEVALTDFEDFGPEARKFHPEAKMFGVERHGVNAEWFAGLMKDAGFVNVEVKPAWHMEKEVEKFPGEWGQEKPERDDLEKMVFPFLLCRGRKAD